MTLKNIGFILLYILLIPLNNLHAQNINGLEIFVSKTSMIMLDFHSPVTNYSFLQKKAPYEILTMDAKSISLSTVQEVKDAYILRVIEGGRSYLFTIKYKDDIDPSEMEYDFSDLKQLKKLINNSSNKPSLPNNTIVNNQNIPAPLPDDKNTQVPDKNVQTNIMDNSLFGLVNAGDNAKKNNQLPEAKIKYEQALKIDTGNNYAKAQLKEVNTLLDAKYNEAMTKANNAFSQNQFEQSLNYYNQALTIRENDKYATGQIQLVQNKIQAAKAEEQRQQKEIAYKSYISVGDKGLADKTYDVARNAYREALKLKPGDAVATAKINSIDQKIISDNLEEEEKKKEELYNSFINAGNKSMKDKLYSEAKTAYDEASKIKPQDPVAKAKLNSVDQQLFTDFVNTGNNALKDKLYGEAKNAYDEALKIKPGEASVKLKLNNLETQRIKDSADRLYADYMNSGDKALNDRSYETAKIAYTEALKVKPNDAAANTKLKSTEQKISTGKIEDELKKTESLYNGFLNAGNKAMEEKSYNEAKSSYNEALKIKPGDSLINSKLIAINEILYSSFVISGDNAMKAKSYNEARTAYQNALELKHADNNVITKLNSVDIQKTQDSLNEVFDNYVTSGDKALSSGSLNAAGIAFTEALKIKPENEVVIAKLASLNQKIIEDSTMAIQKKTEFLYSQYIDSGNISFNGKLFNDAKNYYNNALLLKPGDDYATGRIKTIDSLSEIKINNVQDTNEIAQKAPVVRPEFTIAGMESTDRADVKAALDIGKNMLFIKARFFKMGSDVGATDESPMHIVKLDSFYISRFEVTQSQWKSIMGNNPSFFKDCDNCPVENVSWDDAMIFIEKLNKITKRNFRLPTEAEWEYVAGTQSKKNAIESIAWYSENAKNKTHDIGSLQPDFLGVYDMFGNVAEWCSDWYSFSSYKKNMAVNPAGPADGKEKVVRGGNWYDWEGAFRISIRDKATPNKANKKTGVRLAMSSN